MKFIIFPDSSFDEHPPVLIYQYQDNPSSQKSKLKVAISEGSIQNATDRTCQWKYKIMPPPMAEDVLFHRETNLN